MVDLDKQNTSSKACQKAISKSRCGMPKGVEVQTQQTIQSNSTPLQQHTLYSSTHIDYILDFSGDTDKENKEVSTVHIWVHSFIHTSSSSIIIHNSIWFSSKV
eukprot:TRINITY_DN3618_c1_g1_i4.p3 TRINITY_DN3618_c1_g1~~TRINITY_DN3618_c1_g1_i4.p3  ORF type:complete len:103 (+),score=13.68 TRINITY_DN3618_c1_g1_i4:446-754(+)